MSREGHNEVSSGKVPLVAVLRLYLYVKKHVVSRTLDSMASVATLWWLVYVLPVLGIVCVRLAFIDTVVLLC